MARTVPSVGLTNPGTLITSGAVWNMGPKAMGDFYVSPPVFRGRQTSSILTVNNVWTAMPLQVADIDTETGHSNTVNNTRYTCQVAGWYWVEGFAAWQNSGTNLSQIDCAIYKNGSVVFGSQQSILKPAVDFGAVSGATTVQLAIGDYIEVFGRQATSNNIFTWTGVDLCPVMNAFWIHA